MHTTAPPIIRFESAVPQFTVPDVVRTAEYYRDVLGFEIAGYWDGERASMMTDPPPVFAAAGTGRAEGGLDAYFHVTGVDALAADLRSRGAEIIDGPEDRVYQQREVVVKDCNGLILAFGEDTSHRA